MVDITAAKPFYSVLILAFACSALVAGTVVGLRPLQDANRQIDQQKNILYAAGLYQENTPIDTLFANIETRIVDLASGTFVDDGTINPASFNQRRAAFTDELGRDIPDDSDAARLSRQEKYSLVYLVKDHGAISQIVLPVRGKGLWSTMYAYVAVDSDLTTIRGVSFYEHGETPGLGGEIENRSWQDSWQGKQVYRDDAVALQVVKGAVDTANPDGAYQIDGLSGSTLTANGVSGLLEFWFGEHGFKPFFEQIKKETVKEKGNG